MTNNTEGDGEIAKRVDILAAFILARSSSLAESLAESKALTEFASTNLREDMLPKVMAESMYLFLHLLDRDMFALCGPKTREAMMPAIEQQVFQNEYGFGSFTECYSAYDIYGSLGSVWGPDGERLQTVVWQFAKRIAALLNESEFSFAATTVQIQVLISIKAEHESKVIATALADIRDP